jgi:hypothetical protein
MYWLMLQLFTVAAIGKELAQLSLLAQPRLSTSRWIVEIDDNLVSDQSTW